MLTDNTISKKHIIILLIIIILFHVLNLFPVFSGVMPNGGDTGTHFQLLQETVSSIKGQSWLDNNYNLGFPMFLYYTPLPYITLALLNIITFIPLLFLFKLSIFLFFIIFPLIIYKSSVIMEFTKLQSVCSAFTGLLISSSIGFGIEHRVMFDFGLYSQLWGIVFFPLAIAYVYQYLIKNQDHSLWKAIIFSFLTFSSHLLMGLLVGVTTIILLAANNKISKELIKKTLLYIILFFISVSYFIVPYFLNTDYYGGLSLDDPIRNNGYGISETIKLCATGKLLDYRSTNNLPVLTVFLGLGIIIFLFKKEYRDDKRLRFLFYAIIISLFFIAGKAAFSFIEYVPIIKNIQTFRFIILLHYAAIFIIGFMLSAVIGSIQKVIPKKRYVSIVPYLLLIIILSPAILDNVAAYKFHMKADINEDDNAYFKMINELKKLPDLGRVRIDAANFPKAISFVNSLPTFSNKPSIIGNGIGYHDTLSTFYSAFPDNLPFNHSKLFNVKYIVSREKEGNKYTIKETSSNNYFELGHARYFLYTAPKDSQGVNLVWSWSGLPKYNEYFIMSRDKNLAKKYTPVFVENYEGFIAKKIREDGVVGTVIEMTKAPVVKVQDKLMRADDFVKSLAIKEVDCGKVLEETAQKGYYTAKVDVKEEGCIVIIKVSYHPDWELKVNKTPVEKFPVSQNYIAVDIPKGQHEISAEFKVSLVRKVFIAISLLSLVLVWYITKKRSKNAESVKEKDNENKND